MPAPTTFFWPRRLLFACWLALVIVTTLPGPAHAATDVTLYVNNQHPKASDSNAGTQDKPLKTISAAASKARTNRKNGKATLIRIADSTYRESIDLSLSDGSPITFEAIHPGTVIISGSDIWRDWQAGSNGTFTRAWPHNWGVAPNPWADDIEVPTIVRRHELLAVDGQILRQVLSRNDLAPGTFHIDEAANRITIQPSSGIDLNRATVEVGMRERLLRIQGGNNVTVRGLTFQHSTEVLDQAAVVVQDAEHILIENCLFQWNNAVGLKLYSSRNVTVRASQALHNGFDGMAGYKLRDLLLEDNTTSHNNWRGGWGDFFYWATGQKFMSLHGATIRRHQSFDNQSRGFWLDTDNVNVRFEGRSVHDNRRDGLFIEANVGPIVVRDSSFARNGNAGVLLAHSEQVTLDGNTLCGNSTAQIRVTGTSTSREVRDWETGARLKVWAEDATFLENTVLGDGSQLLITTVLPSSPWQRFVQSLTADDNHYFHPTDRTPFQVSGGKQIDFTGWQRHTSEEAHSTWGDLAAPAGCEAMQAQVWEKLPDDHADTVGPGGGLDSEP